MQFYIIIGFICSTILGYGVYLKFDNMQLMKEISRVQAQNKSLEASIKLEKAAANILLEKQEKLLGEIKELENRPVKTEVKFVPVKDCKVEISKVETDPVKAEGIPKFLGNIGG